MKNLFANIDVVNDISEWTYDITKYYATILESEGISSDEAWILSLRKTIIENIKDRLRSKRYSEEKINTEVLEFFKYANGYYSHNIPKYNYYRNNIELCRNFVIATMTRKFKEDGYPTNMSHNLMDYYLQKVFSDTNTDTYSYTHSTDLDLANIIEPEPVGNQQPTSFMIPVAKDVKFVSKVQRGEAGFSFEDDQKLNFAEAEYKQKLGYKHNENREIERHTKAENEEAERHAERMQEIHSDLSGGQANRINSFLNPNAGGNSFTYENDGNLDYFKLASLFIKDMSLVKEGLRRDTDKCIYYRWDEDNHIYFEVSVNGLRERFKEFVYNQLDARYSSFIVENRLDNAISAIRYKSDGIPTIEQSGLSVADGNQTFFPNGYFDAKKGEFIPTETRRWFHKFCMPYTYNEDAPEPVFFNGVLSQIFDGDKTKIELTYQITGALISDIRNLKYLYVFQGVTGSGKTTLASIILKLLHKKEYKKINSINDLSKNEFKSLEKSVKLVCVKDSGQEALRVNTVGTLKAYVSGDFDEDDVYFNILLQTNNAIYTDKNGIIEEALYDRLLVLPFTNDLKNSSEENLAEDFIENHFEEEKQGIVKKALEALHRVISNGKNFANRFLLNKVIGHNLFADDPAKRKQCFVEACENLADKDSTLRFFVQNDFEFISQDEFNANIRNGITPADFLEYLKSKTDKFNKSNTAAIGKKLKELYETFFISRELPDKSAIYYNLRLKNVS